MEDLTDRQAADAVRTRLDWKYALGMELDDPGFNFSVLSEFRDRLVVEERAAQLLDAMLSAAREAGLVKAGGKARTDSTHVLAAIRKLNRLELIGESVRLALEQPAEIAPGWLGPRLRLATRSSSTGSCAGCGTRRRS
jgi:transposase